MIYRKTKDYDSFRCIAGDCPESCCIGWQIMIDEESLARYRKMPELDREIDWEEACFLQRNGRCSMLREDNLCKLQAAKGEEILCETCHRYPRHIEEYEDEREYSLSISCPECARLLLTDPAPMEFVEWSDEEVDDSFEEFDFLLYSGLCESREGLYEIATDRTCSVGERLERILQGAKYLQLALDEGEYDALQTWREGAMAEKRCSKGYIYEKAEICEEADIRDKVMLTAETIRNSFSTLYELEHLNPQWVECLDRTWERVFGAGCELNIPSMLSRELSERESIQMEKLLMFFLYTYYLGAVYDDMIYSKVALSVYSVVFIYCIYFALRSEENDTDTMISVVYRYAREIEHSDENLNALEDYYDGTMPR